MTKDQRRKRWDREYSRQYYKTHREHVLAKNRNWAKENPERVRAIERKYCKFHPEARRIRDRRNYSTPKGRARVLACHANQRAKRLGVSGTFTGAQFLRLCKRFGNRCVCCGRKGKLGPDHVIPMFKGGSNRISNIQPMLIRCNVCKANKVIDYRKFRLRRRFQHE